MITEPPRVLVVDDEAALRRTYARALTKAGCDVTQTATGVDALAAVRECCFDVIVSDVSMPGMTGVELLRRVREHDSDVPVMLVTGSPSIETAAEAVDHGALRYLLKPLKLDVLVDHVRRATKLRRLAQVKREAIELLGGDEKLLGEVTSLENRFAAGMRDLWMAYQPIVGAETTRIIAYEALVRTREPSFPHPGALFEAAERLGRVVELGRRIRDSVAATLATHNPQVDVFVNLHGADLTDETLYDPDSPLSAFASQVVLEITERVALDHRSDVSQRIRRLRSLGYRIAIDDLGAGYAGLNYFALLTPDVVKLDMTLVRDVDSHAVKQKLVGSFTSLCKQLGMKVVAEGIETVAERDMVVSLGADLLQGYLYAKPGTAFPELVISPAPAPSER